MWAVSRKNMAGVYEVPGSGNGKARPRFKTEAERIGHRETVRRRDESRFVVRIRIAADAAVTKRPRLRSGAEQKKIDERKTAIKAARKARSE